MREGTFIGQGAAVELFEEFVVTYGHRPVTPNGDLTEFIRHWISNSLGRRRATIEIKGV